MMAAILTEGDALLDEISRKPHDVALRGIYADWLEDAGRPDEAAKMREEAAGWAEAWGKVNNRNPHEAYGVFRWYCGEDASLPSGYKYWSRRYPWYLPSAVFVRMAKVHPDPGSRSLAYPTRADAMNALAAALLAGARG